MLAKKNTFRQIIELIFVITVVAYLIPAVKGAVFPTRMDKVENMLRNAALQGYRLSVDRKSKSEIVLTVYDGGKSATVQIYRDVMHELEPVDSHRIFFAHAINDNSKDVVYLSRTRMVTDKDFKKLLHLEVTVCGRIKDQTGNVGYEGHEPIYECEVPIQKISASAKK